MSDSDEQESILTNLSKTRQLWNSKADLGTPNYLIPKSLSTSVNSKKQTIANDSSSAPEVIRPGDQEIENYELPDIKAMKSQWENPVGNTAVIPMPSAKSPAAIAEEKSRKEKLTKSLPEPANRVEDQPNDDVYDVELNKLKAQFESAARAASKPRPKSPKTPKQNNVIKDQVTRNSTAKQSTAGNTNKKLRFEDEMTLSNEKFATEQRIESENLSVNLSGLKTQFENRKDENLVTPQLSHKKIPENTGFNRFASTTTRKQSSQENTSNHDETVVRDEPIKSSEPVYDQMTGEESVKDRLKRFNSISETNKSLKPFAAKRNSQKRDLAPILKRDVESESVKVSQEFDIVRSPPAGTRETPDYVGSVDLRQTKALFEVSQPKPFQQSLSRSSSSPNISSPPRTGRSSVSSNSRRSSRHSTASSRSSSLKRSKSPAPNTKGSSLESVEVDMADIVKSPPAGTKETPDYVPAVKVSSMKNMFESSDSPSSKTSLAPAPRRQPSKDSWVKPDEDEEVVRPASAGTKEVPDYNLSSDFLKSRAAIFNSPAPKVYTPRNKFNDKQDNTPREIVNAQPDKPDTDYELTKSLRDTKKMFENGASVAPSTTRSSQKKTSVPASDVVRSPVADDVVRPSPAGTREPEIIPASNLKSAKSVFEKEQKADAGGSRKKPIDIRSEAAEAQQREKQIVAEKLAPLVQQEKDVATEPEALKQEVDVTQPEPEQLAPEPEPLIEEPEAASSDNKVEEVKGGTKAVVVDYNDDVDEEEEGASESESESEGEYVVEKKDEPEQSVDQQAEVFPVNGEVGDEPNVEEDKDFGMEADEQDPVDVEQSNLKKTNNGDVTQEKAGTSLIDDDSFDKPHFRYEYDDDTVENPTVPGASLLDLEQVNLPASNLLDSVSVASEEAKFNGEVSFLDQLAPVPAADRSQIDLKSENSLLIGSLSPSNSAGGTDQGSTDQSGTDLLNGFADIATKPIIEPTSKQTNLDPFGKIESSDPNPIFQSDPFDLFSSAPPPATSAPQNKPSDDPFDLFK